MTTLASYLHQLTGHYYLQVLIYTATIAVLTLFVAVLVWRKPHWAYDYEVVNLPPISQLGIEGTCSGCFVKATEKGSVEPSWFQSTTLILGYDPSGRAGPASAAFNFHLPANKIRHSRDTYATLTVEAAKTHGGLHSAQGPNKKIAIVEANGVVIDKIHLIDRMPHGQDFGFHDVGPIELDAEILSESGVSIKLTIDDEMNWDIDRVTLRLALGMQRPSLWGGMMLGAAVATIFGLIPIALEKMVG
jgi:hypothetical protein